MSSPPSFGRSWWGSAVVLWAVLGPVAAADRPASDHVTLRNATKLRGLVFAQSDKSLTLLVSAKWLATANAKLFSSVRQQNLDSHKLALEQAVRRLKTEQPPAAEPAIAAFDQHQLEDVEAELAKVDHFQPEFLWLTLPTKDVARVEAADPKVRPVLAWAWAEKLDRAETRSADDLSRELKDRNVSAVGWPLRLIEQLPARQQSDDEWVARRALVEHTLGKRLEFQGTGDVLARAGQEVQAADVGQLLVEVLRGQLQSQLGELLNEGKPASKAAAGNAAKTESLRKAVKVAEAEKRSGFRVTRLEFGGDFQQALVITQFVARMPDGSWRTIFQHVERADAQQIRPDLEKQIQDDARVKQVLDLARQFGVAADEQIQRAVRFGAATMTAQQACHRQFAAVCDTYVRSLVKPPFFISGEN